MQITVRYQAVDGFKQTRRFGKLSSASDFAMRMVGANPDFGSTYAVSVDGIGKVEVTGCSLKELFGKKAEPAKVGQFGVAYGYVNEDSGATWWTTDDAQAFATIGEAKAFIDGITELGCDGIRIVGFTDTANALLQKWREEQDAIAEAAAEIPF